MKRRLLTIIMVIMAVLPAMSLSFALDSIAEWGKFPRFIVNTYRWGDRFFNTYDSTYVVGTGYKFNVKLKADSWQDYYNFDLPDNMRMRMLSDPSTSVGVSLQYMAVSASYDMNISKYFGWNTKARKRFTFGFSCSLFAVDFYFVSNNVGSKISKFGPKGNTFNPHINFTGLDNHYWGFDAYYFFNHKKYSQGAAFTFSKVQKRSQGSFYAGLSYSNRQFDFDFSGLPEYMKAALPDTWADYRYSARTRDYYFKVGYGYNWVFANKWVLGISESPLIGFKKGFINNDNERKTTFALSNQLRASIIWNSNNSRWFAGGVADVNMGLIYSRDNSFLNAVITGALIAGWRFNLW